MGLSAFTNFVLIIVPILIVAYGVSVIWVWLSQRRSRTHVRLLNAQLRNLEEIIAAGVVSVEQCAELRSRVTTLLDKVDRNRRIRDEIFILVNGEFERGS